MIEAKALEMPSYMDFERGPMGQSHDMPTTQEAFMLLQDFGPGMLPCLIHIFDSALEQKKINDVISKLQEIYQKNELHRIWPPSIPGYIIMSGKTVRGIVGEEVCKDILAVLP